MLSQILQRTMRKAVRTSLSVVFRSWRKEVIIRQCNIKARSFDLLCTFSPIASCIIMVSVDILSMISPVPASLSKYPISCLSIALRYKFLIRTACLSPVIIQHVTSAKTIQVWSDQVFLISMISSLDWQSWIHGNNLKYLRENAAIPDPMARYKYLRDTWEWSMYNKHSHARSARF